jgi:hypothetical protein
MINNLPIELIIKILHYSYPYQNCDLYWFHSLSTVCKKWKSILYSKWIYYDIIQLGKYPVDDKSSLSLVDLIQTTYGFTQYYCIEQNYDSRILDIFGDDYINIITKLPVYYNLPFDIIEFPDNLMCDAYSHIYQYFLNHTSPIQRGITTNNIHYISFRIYDSYTKKKKIEFLFHEKKETYFDPIRNRFINVYPEWSFSATNKNETQYLGDLGIRVKKEVFKQDNIISYLWGKSLDIINLDYIKRLIKREYCGYIVPKCYLRKNSNPSSIIQFYVESDENFNRIDEDIFLTGPLVYLE